MKWTALAMALATTTGCATTGADRAGESSDRPEPVRITYETGPCFGTCPVYGIDVASDGTGRFDGKRFTAVEGTRSLPVTPAQYRAFAAALAPHRPASGEVRFSHGTLGCRMAPTDMPSVTVRWSEASGAMQTLYYYFGCDGENPGKSQALRATVDALPVAALIGPRPGTR